jgi:arginine/ornithine N-succinyltransferase beta subunit
MDSVRDDISTLLLANKNHEPLKTCRDETGFFNFWEGVKKTIFSVFFNVADFFCPM